MKLLACHPTRRTLFVTALAVLVAFLLPFVLPGAMAAFVAVCLVATGLCVADLVLAMRLQPLHIERQIPSTIAVDHRTPVTLKLHHENAATLRTRIVDCLPESFSAPAGPVAMSLPPGRTSTFTLDIEPVMRGRFELTSTEVAVTGPLGLMEVRFGVPCRSVVSVYPDFAAIRSYTILATDNHVSQLGIFRRKSRGEGSEFHQLRQYQSGDSLRQVNWKATARRQQLISNEYQRERDQQVVLLIDNGRRMCSRDDALSHFDHALNAAILVSYIALRQGDSVGVLGFGHSNRWVPMGRGEGQSSVILNSLYDLQPGNSASDYIGAAETLSVRQRKRSLVLLVTNTRDEDLEDLVTACQILGRRHLVLLANIREGFIQQESDLPVHSFRQALRYTAVQDYRQKCSDTLAALRARGVHCLDCPAQQLPAAVSNAYLEIKSSGML